MLTKPANISARIDLLTPYALLGVTLITFGLVALIYQGVSHVNPDAVLDSGTLHAIADWQRRVPLSPLVGVAAVTIGGALVGFNMKKAA